MRHAFTAYALLVLLLVAAPWGFHPFLTSMGWWPRGGHPLAVLWNEAFHHPIAAAVLLTLALCVFLVGWKLTRAAAAAADRA